MKLTPIERRNRLSALIQADPDCSRLLADYEQANRQLTKLTDRLPRKFRALLWQLPGTGYFLHHRILTLVCETMQFADES